MPVWMSVKPKFAQLILSGVKDVEVRRWLPKTIVMEDRCIVYASSPTCAVLGEAAIEDIRAVRVRDEGDLKLLAEIAHASVDEMKEYLGGKDVAYVISLSDPIKYPRPVPLSELKEIVKEKLGKDFHPNPLFRVGAEVLDVVREAAGFLEAY
ncbi:MAG: ASCH domain-containing protein [Methanopyri archaeon]|nr:ASCH domain-containing protein [Methanopyri archaeon]